jgi:hypothetical protein
MIPECDQHLTLSYQQDWVKDVLPGRNISESSGNFIPENCAQYNFTAIVNEPLPLENNTCLADWFSDEVIRCNDWVFQSGERTIVNDVSVPINLSQEFKLTFQLVA